MAKLIQIIIIRCMQLQCERYEVDWMHEQDHSSEQKEPSGSGS